MALHCGAMRLLVLPLRLNLTRHLRWLMSLCFLVCTLSCASRQLPDRDRGLADGPVRAGVATEPLTGQLGVGVRALRDDDLDTADEALRTHLKANPRSSLANYHLGVIAMQRGDAKAARTWFEAAWALNPQLHGALANLGVLYLQADEEVAALKALQQAHDMAPDDVRVLVGLAQAQLRRGLWSDGVESLQRANELAPGHASILYDYALALMDRMQWRQALTALDEALAVRPRFAKAWAAKVVCIQGLGRVSEAEAVARDALDKLPAPTADNHVALARVLVANKQVPDALAEMAKAVALEPTNPGAQLAYGELAEASGDKQLAIDSYQKYLKLHGRRSDDTRRVRDRLQQLQPRATP